MSNKRITKKMRDREAAKNLEELRNDYNNLRDSFKDAESAKNAAIDANLETLKEDVALRNAYKALENEYELSKGENKALGEFGEKLLEENQTLMSFIETYDNGSLGKKFEQFKFDKEKQIEEMNKKAEKKVEGFSEKAGGVLSRAREMGTVGIKMAIDTGVNFVGKHVKNVANFVRGAALASGIAKNVAEEKFKDVVGSVSQSISNGVDKFNEGLEKMDKAIENVENKVDQKIDNTIEKTKDVGAYVVGAGSVVTNAISDKISKGNDKLMSFAVQQNIKIDNKIKAVEKFSDSLMTNLESRAMRNSDFSPNTESSVVARAASLGTHAVKEGISKSYKAVSDTLTSGFNLVKKGFDNLRDKTLGALSSMNEAGKLNVEARKENAKTKDNGNSL